MEMSWLCRRPTALQALYKSVYCLEVRDCPGRIRFWGSNHVVIPVSFQCIYPCKYNLHRVLRSSSSSKNTQETRRSTRNNATGRVGRRPHTQRRSSETRSRVTKKRHNTKQSTLDHNRRGISANNNHLPTRTSNESGAGTS